MTTTTKPMTSTEVVAMLEARGYKAYPPGARPARWAGSRRIDGASLCVGNDRPPSWHVTLYEIDGVWTAKVEITAATEATYNTSSDGLWWTLAAYNIFLDEVTATGFAFIESRLRDAWETVVRGRQ